MMDFDTDFGSILDQLGLNFGPNLAPFWTKIGALFSNSSQTVRKMVKIGQNIPTWLQLGSILDLFWLIFGSNLAPKSTKMLSKLT